MQEQTVIETQLEFYRKGRAGCLFAAYVAKDPERFGWRLSVSDVKRDQIDNLIQSAISLRGVSTQSIIFPSIIKTEDLKRLLIVLKNVPSLSLEQEEEFEGSICLGYRVCVGELTSWVTGFGGFDFLPKTRQSILQRLFFALNQDLNINR